MLNLVCGSGFSSTGGIQAVNRILVRELDSAGLMRRAFFLDDRPETAGDPARDYLRRGLVSFHHSRRTGFLAAMLLSALRHPRDHWFSTHVNHTAFALLAALGRRRRAAVMLHAHELGDNLTGIRRAFLRRAGMVVTVSEYTKSKAIALGVRRDRIRVLHNGVDDPCPGGPPVRTTDPAVPTVLFVGRMDERYKGQMELLDALTLLHARWPGLRVVFVGGGGYLSDWRGEAERRALGGAVTFTGRVADDELARLYATATAFAMPSENEGFGLVYAEAMAHGLPCIGGDQDAAREVIAHDDTGLCVPARNSTALADAIATLLKSPELGARMGRAGRERFLKHFSATAYRERLLALMRDWLGEAGGQPAGTAAGNGRQRPSAGKET